MPADEIRPRGRSSLPGSAGVGKGWPHPHGRVWYGYGPPLPVWEGEIAHAAKGNKHEETSPDKKTSVSLV